ncbi:triose-phosphate isomerase [Dyadobacter fanqingshengii]|uniref:Triosephosphate isomerase n=1 Tax=Dyadobacter fanqingshengii TaxID=2906443 RepID=A0A9X1PFI9_9BACT|nr:triose-phosphate isomerase [Dyadobacter fanqingshengii]MCF0043540.1 triose-phosphate isomerase [Dyadobacter fanqingshengii]MCF2504113.1 triose-phosphate isomerase [Dyadobacter fanqingshengii]USJ34841.1 triose-phosphate isomerase [Dyadobacter fanqingshengii]
MRKKIVAGNWKMNKVLDEAVALTSELVNMANDEVQSDVKVILCPPSIYLTTIKKYLESAPNFALAAQNCSDKVSGAYTGEISAQMLQSIGVEYVLVGHSERRQYFNESNAVLAEKVNTALANGVSPIFCCGESLDQRQNEDYIGFVKNQITESLFHLSEEQLLSVIIAYEPIWAIGTGLTASAEQAQEMHASLRQHIASKYGADIAEEISILYGGSVTAASAAELFSSPDIDGGLVGGASLKSREFTNIIKAR